MMYPDRRVSSIFSQDEIQLLIDRRDTRRSISKPVIQDAITNRYYQKEDIVRTCEDFEKGSRKALLVMATGSGKTRVAISLVDVLTKADWAKNILFLADRTALVNQAKKNFVNLLPSLTTCNLCENKEDSEVSRMIFSSYPTMMNAIDETRSKDGNRLFTPGHFDLIILDESHRSIYNKYKDIFDYFDALLIDLTATPKDSIGANTYSIFDLETGVPTYAYEYETAVKDKYLVSYHSYETKMKFLEEGIHYDELSDEEKKEFEEHFSNTDTITSSEMNKFVFNINTIDTVI
ncbi:type I restriction enzyme EcoKI subunit R [Catenibacterium mitsuokai]|uniref:DEAD/DEAH box helicase family protein n=1 Tax=Catenibacterium mitsuokai TaxID=100886 RepID=UPI0006C0A4D3|nr:DEAD/DEAH box helicase family protein [Catenibacterium mitsuokai]CUO58725.1 type I restriction enzyme EcoKI subunit R [Catenibacterium mitsuokai]